MTEVEFDEATHTYRVAGEIVPGVTSILSDLSAMKRLDPAMLAAAAERGKLVHKAVELFNRDDLDEESLDPALEPYLRAWKRFAHDRGYKPITNETIIYSDRWGYAGQFDTYGTIKATARRSPTVLIDVKSGVADPVHGPQTAAYLEPGRDMGLVGKLEIPLRMVVRLQPNGFYQVDEYRDPKDWSTFLAALTTYRFKEAQGLL